MTKRHCCDRQHSGCVPHRQAELRKSDTRGKNTGYDYIHTKMKNWQNLSLVLEVRMSYFWRGRTGKGVIEGDLRRATGVQVCSDSFWVVAAGYVHAVAIP